MATNTESDIWAVDEQQFPNAGDPRPRYEFLLRYARLAPSSHNSQPWLFEITADSLLLSADTTRALPIVDPHNRELIISCGCALEFLCVAARYFGYESRVEYKQSSRQPNLLASFSFGESCRPSAMDKALFKAIPNRHTNRSRFDDQLIPHEVTRNLQSSVVSENLNLQLVSDEAERAAIAKLISEADRVQAHDRHFRKELASWVHPNRSDIKDGMPGYAFGAGDVASVFGPLVLRTFDWGLGQAAKDEQLAIGSPLLVVFKTPSDSRTDWIRTGRALSKVLLFLTDQGLSASYLNQPIEVQSLRDALKLELGDDGDPQILLRVGYGTASKPTPRRAVSDILKK